MPDTSTTTTAMIPVTDADLAEVRGLVENALRHYAATASSDLVAGVHPLDLADNVRGWTHSTRLRDYLEGIRK